MEVESLFPTQETGGLLLFNCVQISNFLQAGTKFQTGLTNLFGIWDFHDR